METWLFDLLFEKKGGYMLIGPKKDYVCTNWLRYYYKNSRFCGFYEQSFSFFEFIEWVFCFLCDYDFHKTLQD